MVDPKAGDEVVIDGVTWIYLEQPKSWGKYQGFGLTEDRASGKELTDILTEWGKLHPEPPVRRVKRVVKEPATRVQRIVKRTVQNDATSLKNYDLPGNQFGVNMADKKDESQKPKVNIISSEDKDDITIEKDGKTINIKSDGTNDEVKITPAPRPAPLPPQSKKQDSEIDDIMDKLNADDKGPGDITPQRPRSPPPRPMAPKPIPAPTPAPVPAPETDLEDKTKDVTPAGPEVKPEGNEQKPQYAAKLTKETYKGNPVFNMKLDGKSTGKSYFVDDESIVRSFGSKKEVILTAEEYNALTAANNKYFAEHPKAETDISVTPPSAPAPKPGDLEEKIETEDDGEQEGTPVYKNKEHEFANLALDWYHADAKSKQEAAGKLINFYQANQKEISTGWFGWNLDSIFAKYLPQCKGFGRRNAISPADMGKRVYNLIKAYAHTDKKPEPQAVDFEDVPDDEEASFEEE
jgi:hypothetical protein